MSLPVKSDLITEQLLLGLLNLDSPPRHSLHVAGTEALLSQGFGGPLQLKPSPSWDVVRMNQDR